MERFLKGIFPAAAVLLACVIVIGGLLPDQPKQSNQTNDRAAIEEKTESLKDEQRESPETEERETEERETEIPEEAKEEKLTPSEKEDWSAATEAGKDKEDAEQWSEEQPEIQEGISADMSQGHYYMATAAEHDGYLYYSDRSENEVIRINTDDGAREIIITGTDDWDISGMLMATEEYLYVRLTYPVGYRVAQFTFDGEYIDMVGDIQALSLQFQDGYFYYVSGRLCRREAREGSLVEFLGDSIAEWDFEICDNVIYYRTENQKLWRVNLDGSGQVQLSDEEDRWNIPLKGMIYDGFVYYYGVDLQNGGYKYYRVDFDTLNEEPAPFYAVEIQTPASGGTFIGDIFVYYSTYGEKWGIWGYNMKTGQQICYGVENDTQENGYVEELSPVQVAGATRVYYEFSYKDNSMGLWEETLYCIDMDGENPVNLGDMVII